MRGSGGEAGDATDGTAPDAGDHPDRADRPDVAAFTDTYLPTVNGATYTIESWRDRWRERGGRMDVVYPACDGYDPGEGEHPVRSFRFPFYDGYRVATPWIPDGLDPDVVHVHTPFSLGVAGAYLARRTDSSLVASYHTPTAEYAEYLLPDGRGSRMVRGVTERWERLFLDRADLVLCPSDATRAHLRDSVDVSAPVAVVPNGIDVERFRPVDPAEFLARHDVDTDGVLLGYTGRHGYEKRLETILDAVDRLDRDVTVLFGGDGPARESLEVRARDVDAEVRFLGFLDREDLPAFYAGLDAFCFPSPVETQGLVALEAMACGTPVVGADSGALADTVDEGETGYRFDVADPGAFRAAIERTLAERTRLREVCLDRRPGMSVGLAVDRLEGLYGRL